MHQTSLTCACAAPCVLSTSAISVQRPSTAPFIMTQLDGPRPALACQKYKVDADLLNETLDAYVGAAHMRATVNQQVGFASLQGLVSGQ